MKKITIKDTLLRRIERERDAVQYLTDLEVEKSVRDSRRVSELAPQYKNDKNLISNVIADLAHLRHVSDTFEAEDNGGSTLEPDRRENKEERKIVKNTTVQPPLHENEQVSEAQTDHKGADEAMEESAVRVKTGSARAAAVENNQQESGSTPKLKDSFDSARDVRSSDLHRSAETSEVGQVEKGVQTDTSMDFIRMNTFDYQLLEKLVLPHGTLHNCRCDHTGECVCGCDHRRFIADTNDYNLTSVFKKPTTQFEKDFVTYRQKSLESEIDYILEEFPSIKAGKLENDDMSWNSLVEEAVLLVK